MKFTKFIYQISIKILGIFSNLLEKILMIKIHQKREKIVNFLQIHFINYTLSAIIRLINNYIFNLLNSKKKFLIIKIGFSKIFAYYPFLNLDYFFREGFAIEKLFNQIIDLRKINLSKDCCAEINIRYFFYYIPKKSLRKVMKKFNDILIPGGKLLIEFDSKSLKKVDLSLPELKSILRNTSFNNIEFKVQERNYIIIANKEIKDNDKSYLQIRLNKKFTDILSDQECLIIVNDRTNTNLKDLFQRDVLQNFIKKPILLDIKELNNENISKISKGRNKFQYIFLLNLLEYNLQSQYPTIFKKIKKIFRNLINVHFILPNKDIKNLGYSQYFNKGIIAEICDNNNLIIKSIEEEQLRDKSLYYITTSFGHDIPSKKEKICCLGNYSIRYSQLGFHWDGQIRAFQQLGYFKNLYLDLKSESFISLKKKILKYNPKILWVGLEEYLPLLEDLKKEIKERDITVVYWYGDLFEPKNLPQMGEIIDYVFISNNEQMPLYHKRFKVKNVFYMPLACTPPFMDIHYRKEKYDIGFAGKVDFKFRPKKLIDTPVHYDHNSRTILLLKLAQKYNVKYIQGEYNNISEFYSKCKFVFGGIPHLSHINLYTSNRFFIAPGCGSVHLTNYFKGIEKLVENEKHILWFKNEDDLYHLINKYINNQKDRLKIRKNAIELFHKKHTYINRIQNIMDIINGKTTEFYGFL